LGFCVFHGQKFLRERAQVFRTLPQVRMTRAVKQFGLLLTGVFDGFGYRPAPDYILLYASPQFRVVQ
jgi:hypothetical protein